MKTSRSSRPVAVWLLVGVFMIMVQIVLGGITRLTGSGLSITEWDVITGTLPPLNETQWLAEFDKYRQTPQFRLLNFDFGLGDFKFIYFWEWFHRLWARLIGVVFAIPFLIFLAQRRFSKEMVRPLVVLFILGALQGAVGWIMVASGLTGDAVYVKPTRLAAHFVLALVLLFYTFWAALKLLVPQRQLVVAPRLKNFTVAIIALLFVQLVYGALMAGHKAASAAPTWPDINGSFIPDYIFINPHGLIGFIDDPIMVHFVHRSLAYLLVALIVAWTVQAWKQRATPLFATVRWLPLIFALLQTTLGVLTVLTSIGISAGKWNAFEWMAQLHQVVSFFLLMSLAMAAYVLRKKPVAAVGGLATPSGLTTNSAVPQQHTF
ncbi:COX15/CtaA family protein [Pseudocnuella soli]|uniref:COX15/CtaA family protein n=1 Tax=Pseudocnuella soli TaxID=2502779 RepID=UPI00104B7226|nr:COX15/CtaA family protein [Pseudocnuella soli]